MTRMTRQQAVAALADGVQLDLDAARAILALLERQFQAALRHKGAELAALAEALTPRLLLAAVAVLGGIALVLQVRRTASR